MPELPSPKAWFLGPKAENQEFFERTLLESFRDYCYWRRNFHPEDQAYIRSEDRLKPEFLDYQEVLSDRLFEMLSQLKKSMPFFSPRYLGHMVKDLLMPGTLGYIAAMFYNQNNITQESATITTRFEAEALKTIVKMLGYREDQAWGHLCSGGTVANMEALWVARNVRLFPWQVALACQRAEPEAQIRLKQWVNTHQPDFPWQNPAHLNVQATLDLQTQLYQSLALEPELASLLHQNSVVHLGLLSFARACQTELGAPAWNLRVAYSQNAHYSMRKSLGLLGLGEEAALKIALDADLRMDLNDLERVLNQLDHNDLLLAVVGVYGSTEEGAIDDFEALDQLRKKREKAGLGSFWLHADACYGGYALSLLAQNDSACEKEPKSEAEMEPAAALQTFLQSVAKTAQARSNEKGFWAWNLSRCQRWLNVSRALSLADSISLDPHKLGYLPYPAGSVAYRDYRSREFIRCEAPYLNSETVSETQAWNTPYPGKYTLEGSRPGATSAAIWLAHQTVPLNRQGHGRLVAGTVVSTVYLQEVLKAVIAQELTGIHCVFLSPEPDLNILCYGFTGSWQGQPLSLKESNLLVEELYQRLLARELQPQQTQDFIVSMTRLERGTYSKSQLESYWHRLSGDPLASLGAEKGLAFIRTVVMDPFLIEAVTRADFQSHTVSLCRLFALTLSQQIKQILALLRS
jgi:glutamate/tyrosine decarboxylase-like PLP-dependent enzyme